MNKKTNKLEEELFYEEDFEELPPSDIVAYNELRSCSDLYRMYDSGILEIQPEFQREFVWVPADQTRFIDSLIKQLPIPSMCFSLDYKTQKWQVIDGLQRMSTIIRFLADKNWKLSKLADIDPKISGKPVSEFSKKDSVLNSFYLRVENLSLPITVLRCDYSKPNHVEYLFTIFHRLNTGGARLNNQEIRNCIYSGPFNNLLKDLNELSSWRKINRMKPEKSYRFTKIELILRFFAFEERYSTYPGKLAKFLNDYMHDKKNLSDEALLQKRVLFIDVANYIFETIFNKKIPSKMSIALLEALMFGIAKNLNYLKNEKKSEVQKLFEKLQNDTVFSDVNLQEGLSKKEKVLARLNIAKEIFSGK